MTQWPSIETAFEQAEVVAILPVTVNDEEIDLVIHKDEDPSSAVKDFCAENMPDSGSACVNQLLPHVINKLVEKGL